MFRFASAVLLTTFVATNVFATSNDGGWKADIDAVTTELPRRHANAFFHISKQTFDSASKALIAQLPSLTDSAAAVGLYRLVAMIGDGHTSVSGWKFSSYPFEAYWFEEGIYLTRVAVTQSDLLGSRIVAVNGKPIDEVTAAVATVFSHENDSWMRSQVPVYLAYGEVLAALGITTDEHEARFTFAAADGTLFERTLQTTGMAAGWDAPPPSRAKRDANLNYWAQYYEASSALFVKYNLCMNDPKKPFATFINEALAGVGNRPIDKLVIDLRDNPGGDTAVFQPLLSRIQSTPALNRRDHLLVLIGRSTFSSALINALELKQQTNAILIGEPTGGKPNSYGEVRTYALPNSRLTLWYSTKFFQLLRNEDPPSLAPHVVMPPSAAAFFGGGDNVLDALIPPVPLNKRRTSAH
jgi:hypothetical protein